jgi:hypothetical protein
MGYSIQFFFLHQNSSLYAKTLNQKPTLFTPTIIFPFHIHGSHWVTIVRRIINNHILFFYSDNMNNKNTEDTIREYFSLANTSHDFAPTSASWMKCDSLTYLPHSNECGPKSLLAASVIATHPTPSESILLPYMNPNIAQISKWWVTKSILNQKFELSNISGLFHHISVVINTSRSQPAILFNLAPLTRPNLSPARLSLCCINNPA